MGFFIGERSEHVDNCLDSGAGGAEIKMLLRLTTENIPVKLIKRDFN
jgi:hypothetical protein